MESDGQDSGSDQRRRGRQQGVNANSLLAKTSTGSNLSSYARLTPFPSFFSLLLLTPFPTSPPPPTIFPPPHIKCLFSICPYLLHVVPLPTTFLFISRTLVEIRERITSSLSPTPLPPAVAQWGGVGGGGTKLDGAVLVCAVLCQHMMKHVRV